MRVWDATTVIANAEAQAATVDDSGRTQFFFQGSGEQSFIAGRLEIDRFGGVTGGVEPVLGVAYDDPTFPVIYGESFEMDAFDPELQFMFALHDADGSTLLFALNGRETFSHDGEPSDYAEPYVEYWLTSRFLTAYRLSDAAPGANGLVPYADHAFAAQGDDFHATYEQLYEIYFEADDWYYDEFRWRREGSTEFTDPSALTFDSGGFLATYRLDVTFDGFHWEYADAEQTDMVRVDTHIDTSQIFYQFVDMDSPSLPAAVLLDATPVGTSVVVERPGDQLGVIWINSATSTVFRVSMAAVDATGAVTRTFKADIAASELEGAPALGAMTVLDAAAAADGSIVALVENAGRPYLARFDRGLHLEGQITAVEGGRWGGSHPEHVSQSKIVHLPGGGFVLAFSLEADAIAGGADHRLIIQQYDADGVEAGRPMKLTADGGWFTLGDLGDGRLSLAWTHGGDTLSQVLDTRTAGFTETGTDGKDTIIGTAFADTLHGGLDADRLVGGAGNDRLFGEAGNDVLVGGDGADRLNGGDGRDVARYDAASVVDLLDRSQNTGQALGDILISIEHLRGSFQVDVFRGTDAADILEGNGAADTLVGRGGNDIIVGGAGADQVQGGAGLDQFRFESLADGGDTIADFVSGQDKIGIDASGFGIASISLVTGVNPTPSNASAVFLFETDTGFLSFDADGNGAGQAVQLATLTGVSNLGTTDFLLI